MWGSDSTCCMCIDRHAACMQSSMEAGRGVVSAVSVVAVYVLLTCCMYVAGQSLLRAASTSCCLPFYVLAAVAAGVCRACKDP
jgi:hypothetical protein